MKATRWALKCRMDGKHVYAHLVAAAALVGGLLGIPGPVAAGSDSTRRLVLVTGSVINAYFDGGYRTIKRADTIYGYGWLDDHRVFVAYQQPGTAEAVAVLEVVDLRRSQTVKLMELGGVGESNFDVNPSTGEIVYNDVRGVHLLKISGSNGYVISDIRTGVDSDRSPHSQAHGMG